MVQTLTEGQNTQSFAKVACLAISTASVLEHPHDKTELAKETMFSKAIRSDMRFR